MHGLGFNRFAAVYLSRVKTDGLGTLPKPHTPYVVNKFAADVYGYMYRKPGAMWPIIGATQEAHKVDLFGRFDLIFSGTVSHDATYGMFAGWQSGVANSTATIKDLFPDATYWSFGCYVTNDSANDAYGEMGYYVNSIGMAMSARNTAGNMMVYIGSTLMTAPVPNSLGLFWVNRHGTSASIWRNAGGLTSSTSLTTSSLPPYFAFIHAAGAWWSQRWQAFIFCCPMNQPDGSGLYNLVQALQTHLGRAV